jgi:hypothetical protein
MPLLPVVDARSARKPVALARVGGEQALLADAASPQLSPVYLQKNLHTNVLFEEFLKYRVESIQKAIVVSNDHTIIDAVINWRTIEGHLKRSRVLPSNLGLVGHKLAQKPRSGVAAGPTKELRPRCQR